MASINYFSEKINFRLSHPRKTSQWLAKAARKEGRTIACLNYIFCSDHFLLRINKKYLNHATLTDIITFDHSESKELEGEIYISVKRVSDNAKKFQVAFEDELHRVMIHGILHLLGYNDKKASEKAMMRKKEDAYLSLRK